MSLLFVLNPTVQHKRVWYRLDYSLDGDGNKIHGRENHPKYLDIPAGHQIKFGGDWHVMQISEIVQQLEFGAGAVPMADIKTAKAKGLVHLVWNQDTPIPRPICEDVKAHNMGYLTQEGDERRHRMAVAADYRLREISEETGMGDAPSLEMEYEMAGEGDEEVSRLERGFRVQRPADAPRGRGRPRKS